MLAKSLKFAFLTLMAYLLQASVAQRIAIGGVAPNLAMALTAICAVGLGRKYAFVMSMTVGYLLEIMMPAVSYISIIGYPVCCMLGAIAFSDKSERVLEEYRTRGKETRQLNPHIRTMLCAMMSVSLFELVNLVYTHLTGVALADLKYMRAVVDIVYTVLLAGIFQFPIRWWMGVYRLKKAK